MRVIIADDEQPSRDELRYLLSKIEGIEIVGEAVNGEDTLNKVRTLQADVLFLDVEMPDASGVDLARRIAEGNIKIAVVFATAYNKYAINAFDVNAVDYLLKPFHETRLADTITRLNKRLMLKSPNESSIMTEKPIPNEFLNRLDQIYSILQPTGGVTKLKVEENEKIYLISVDQIIYATIEERLVRIVTERKNYLTNYNLNELECTLGNNFLRVHKSFLANINKVESIIPWFNNTYNLIMVDGSKIPVSRTYVKSFRRKVGL